MESAIWNRDMECMKRADMEALQLERLKALVDYCDRHVEFYHKRLEAAGVTADKIKALSDIRYIPYTTKGDLRDTYPFGMFSVPKKEMVRLHASSGTTGNPTVVGYTRGDLENWSEQVARLVVAAGATDESVVQICFGYGMFTGALGLHYGLEKIGATVVPTSSGNTEKQLKFMRDFGTDTIVATPSYCLYLAESARERAQEFPMDQYGLRLGLLGSEGCTPEMREQIERRWGGGFFATDNYGLSELNGPGMSGECRERCGLHINEDHFLCEVIDSNTLEVLEPGATGELVVTNLTKRGLPMLRYRTKDITRIDYEPCACGRTIGAYVQNHRPQRRHAENPGGQRLPYPGGKRPYRRGGNRSPLSAGGPPGRLCRYPGGPGGAHRRQPAGKIRRAGSPAEADPRPDKIYPGH